MRKLGFHAVLGCLAAVLAAGCQVTKSSNPLSPSVAGPIAGVNISAPSPLEPGQDWQIRMRDQPVKLWVQNGSSSGVRPITYTFEVAADAAFTNIVFKRSGVPAGSGTTSLVMPDNLPTGKTYWWRAKADDGANSSEYSKTVSFFAVQPVRLVPPSLVAPIGSVPTTMPEFVINPDVSGRSGPVERLVYQLQVANDPGFSSIAWTAVQDELSGGDFVMAKGYSFLNNKMYYWRVAARDLGESQAQSDWSNTQTFTTAYIPPAPTPAPGGGGGGGGPVGNGNWKACGSTPGQDLVECVRNAVYVVSTEANAFDITKRVAWLLRGQGAGLLIKNGGENIISWQGYSFSISRIVYPNGALIKVLSDAGHGGTNGATWDTSLYYAGAVDPALYVAPINPDLP